MPRTHGRLYERWILPDWLNIPVDRRKEMRRILEHKSVALDNMIQSTSNSNQKQYRHPNESILLPSAHWPSSSALCYGTARIIDIRDILTDPELQFSCSEILVSLQSSLKIARREFSRLVLSGNRRATAIYRQ